LNTDLILKAVLLRKGDGNFVMYGGALHKVRHPPPEAIRAPDEMDIPAFAHTGAHGEGETGMPGVGHVFPGQFQQGSHGEQIYVDESGSHHMHGIDGVIRAVGQSMLQAGVNIPGQQIVQRAIELHNSKHNENNHLPNIDSLDWRKINLGRLGEQDGEARSNRNKHGLITTYTNSHGDGHRYGTFLESYAIPFNEELGQIMAEAGHPNPQQHSWVRKPYVKPHRLYLTPDGQGGMKFGANSVPSGQLGDDGMLDRDSIRRLGGRASDTRAFQGITSWGTGHHKSNVYHLPQIDHSPEYKGSPQPRRATVDSFVMQMMRVLGQDKDAIANNLVVDSAGARRMINQMQGEVNGKPLKSYFTSEAGIRELGQYLSRYPSFQHVYGENRMPRFDEEGKQKGRASTVGKLHHFFGQRYGDDAEEGRGLDLFMSHSGRVGNYRQHQANKNVAHHVRAKDAFSNAVLAQSLGIDHVQDMPEPEELRAAGIRLHDTPETRADAPRVANILNQIYAANAQAFGHEVKDLPSQEELTAIQPLLDHVIQGGISSDPLALGVPEHIPYSEEKQPITPVGEQQTDTTLTGTPRGDAGAPLRQDAATPTPAPASPSPASPRYPEMMDDRQRVGVRRPVDPATPGLSAEQQARARFAQAPLEDVRDVYTRNVGVLPTAGRRVQDPQPGMTPADLQTYARTGMTTPEYEQERRLRQFQELTGDPYQTRLFDFGKSENVAKVVELLQLEEARLDGAVMKHVPNSAFNSDSVNDVNHISDMMGITPLDVRTILHSQGDWHRISKTYGYDDIVVKVVKVAFGGVL
tara:strand:- start:32255 stop:34672 length:2418 start_codon:yes stop_codon:yes gene_type:complete